MGPCLSLRFCVLCFLGWGISSSTGWEVSSWGWGVHVVACEIIEMLSSGGSCKIVELPSSSTSLDLWRSVDWQATLSAESVGATLSHSSTCSTWKGLENWLKLTFGFSGNLSTEGLNFEVKSRCPSCLNNFPWIPRLVCFRVRSIYSVCWRFYVWILIHRNDWFRTSRFSVLEILCPIRPHLKHNNGTF